MSNFDFLTDEQVLLYRDRRYLESDMFRKIGLNAVITDFSILLGGYVSDSITTSGMHGYFSDEEGYKLEDRVGHWWVKPEREFRLHAIKGDDAGLYREESYSRNIGARPVVTYSSISNLVTNKVRDKNGILEVEYGEYPQTVVEEDFARILENEFRNMSHSNSEMEKTGKSYTTDSLSYDDYSKIFKPRTHIEYEYKGKRYIRFVGDWNCKDEVLSDGREIEEGSPYWVRVEPIKWIIIEEEDIALCKKIIFAGIQYSYYDKYIHNFDECDIKVFMDKFFSKEILPSNLYIASQNEEMSNTEKNTQQTPYGFDYNDVSNNEILKGALESNIPIYLHTRNNKEKKLKMKQIDPNAEIISLKDITLEDLISHDGATLPIWFKSIVDRCLHNPDKMHIVLFDDIDIAHPSIQESVVRIILDGKLDEKLEIPENARIIVGENSLYRTYEKNNILSDAFAHIPIKFTAKELLKDDEMLHLHPALYMYLAYCVHNGEDVFNLESDNNKENINLVRYQMASKLLYTTNKPEMLRVLIGNDFTTRFIQFCNEPVISLENAVSEKYQNKDFGMSIESIYNTIANLSRVSEEEIELVRNFVKRLDSEVCELFDTLWVKGDKERLRIIEELRQNEMETFQEKKR